MSDFTCRKITSDVQEWDPMVLLRHRFYGLWDWTIVCSPKGGRWLSPMLPAFMKKVSALSL